MACGEPCTFCDESTTSCDRCTEACVQNFSEACDINSGATEDDGIAPTIFEVGGVLEGSINGWADWGESLPSHVQYLLTGGVPIAAQGITGSIAPTAQGYGDVPLSPGESHLVGSRNYEIELLSHPIHLQCDGYGLYVDGIFSVHAKGIGESDGMMNVHHYNILPTPEVDWIAIPIKEASQQHQANRRAKASCVDNLSDAIGMQNLWGQMFDLVNCDQTCESGKICAPNIEVVGPKDLQKAVAEAASKDTKHFTKADDEREYLGGTKKYMTATDWCSTDVRVRFKIHCECAFDPTR